MMSLSLATRVAAWTLRLAPAETHDVGVDRDLRVPMPDGAVLLADRYYPRGAGRLPTLLVRSPYGRRGVFGLLYGRLYAERGFQVLLQSCRGTFGSGGEFNPLHHERADGLATVAWLKQQPWFHGAFATNGASYLGYTQWALAAGAGPELKAMALAVTAPSFRRLTYAGEAFALHGILSWLLLIHTQEAGLGFLVSQLTGERNLQPIFAHLPLRDADTLVAGRRVGWWHDWLEHNTPGDPWWQPMDHWAAAASVDVPIQLLGGWYDIFLPDTFAQYAALRRAGRQPYLIVGPWTHIAQTRGSVREVLPWLRAHLLGDPAGLSEQRVRLYVAGADEWRRYADWPPAGAQLQRLHLHAGGRLTLEPPGQSEPDRYRYDPAHPTPNVGGALLTSAAGPRDNRALEARPDVRVYTSAPLEQDLEVIGPVQADLFVCSSREHTDFFVRLCDVDPAGRSVNVTDELLRVIPGRPPQQPDGSLALHIDLSPTARRFRRGHRLRVQVSSGAHPRFARNTGTGEPLGTATRLVAADQAIYHDPAHPSALILPVIR